VRHHWSRFPSCHLMDQAARVNCSSAVDLLPLF
jgi:hypothetical protein